MFICFLNRQCSLVQFQNELELRKATDRRICASVEVVEYHVIRETEPFRTLVVKLTANQILPNQGKYVRSLLSHLSWILWFVIIIYILWRTVIITRTSTTTYVSFLNPVFKFLTKRFKPKRNSRVITLQPFVTAVCPVHNMQKLGYIKLESVSNIDTIYFWNVAILMKTLTHYFLHVQYLFD